MQTALGFRARRDLTVFPHWPLEKYCASAKIRIRKDTKSGALRRALAVAPLHRRTLTALTSGTKVFDGACHSHRYCQTNLTWRGKGADLKRSGCKLTPLNQGGRAVLFEDIAAVKVTVLVEVVVDRGMGGGKLSESFHVSELRHRS